MRVLRLLLCLGVVCSVALAHDLYLKLETYFLEPETDATVDLFNGTFDLSENVITRDRMVDVSIVGPEEQVVHPDPSQWRDVDARTRLSFRTGPSGTYAIGVSTAPRVIELSADDFNRYLEHDGVLDVLEQRRAAGTMDRGARERYAKHVKALVQVGDERSRGAMTEFGYPVEIVPLRNPYELRVGDELPVRVLRGGKALGGQRVYASHEGHHGHDASGAHIEAFRGRTDDAGETSVPLSAAGLWYVRLIHMVESVDDALDYESQWATLTFEVAAGDADPADAPVPLAKWIAGGVAALILLWAAARSMRKDQVPSAG